MDFSSRKNLLSLIALDIIVLLFAAAIIFSRYNSLTVLSDNDQKAQTKTISAKVQNVSEQEAPPAAKAETAKPASPAQQETQPALSAEQNPKISEKAVSDKRNIKFLYRNSKAKKVEIIGDFNDWIPQPLAKGDKHSWSATIAIAPGEYAYDFVVNGKPVRDPNNATTLNTGRGFTSSLLKVKPR